MKQKTKKDFYWPSYNTTTEPDRKSIYEVLPEYLLTPNRFLIECMKQQLTGKKPGIVGYMLKQIPQPEYITNEYPETMMSYEKSTMEMRYKAFNMDACEEGFIAEYGVDDGTSFLPLCEWVNDNNKASVSKVYGFDAFEGLQDGGKWKGNISHQDEFQHQGKIPFVIPSNGIITKGWFEDTLHPEDYFGQKAKYLHIDCDTFEATVSVLEHLADKVQEGTVITFDDYFCQYAWETDSQYSAWKIFVKLLGIRYEYLYCCAPAVTIKIIRIGELK